MRCHARFRYSYDSVPRTFVLKILSKLAHFAPKLLTATYCSAWLRYRLIA